MKILRFNESVGIDLDKVYYLVDVSDGIIGTFLEILKFLEIKKVKFSDVYIDVLTFKVESRIKNGKFSNIQHNIKIDITDGLNGLKLRRSFIEDRLISQSNNYEELLEEMELLASQNKYNL
jgi:hypothetical protein